MRNILQPLFRKAKRVTLFLGILLALIPICMISSEKQNIADVFPEASSATFPNMFYSFYQGGSGDDIGYSIDVSIDNSSYVLGSTFSGDFPVFNAYNDTFGGNSCADVYISKIYTKGSAYLWNTYFGGNSTDYGYGIAVASDGSCYVTGYTNSSNFPTLNAYNSSFGGGDGDAFVAKFSTNGSLLWSSFLGGNSIDSGLDIAVHSDGSCYVIGHTSSTNFPTLNAYNNISSGDADTFVAKFSTTGSLLWSTYFGGSTEDLGYSIALASNGNCYIIGYTESEDFPTLNAYQDTFGGGELGGDAFVAKFSLTGSLLWSTYFGGNEDEKGNGIAVASDGSCYVTGETGSEDFPTLNAYNDTYGGYIDIFVAKFDTIGDLDWSTYYGGQFDDIGTSVDIGSENSCYVIGDLNSNFTTLNGYDDTFNGRHDAIILKFINNGTLLWSSYLGGRNDDGGNDIAVDSYDSFYLTGYTESNNFPTTHGSIYNDDSDAFVTKFSLTAPPIPTTTTEEPPLQGILLSLIVSSVVVLIIYKRRK